MASQSDSRRRYLEISVSTSHPQLLAGLDDWLQRGLISDATVRRLCQERLTCRLPTPAAQPTSLAPGPGMLPPSISPQPVATGSPAAGVSSSPSIPHPSPVRDRSGPSPTSRSADLEPALGPFPQRPQTGIARFLQSLMAELSVLWLLGLGVVLVVVSSAVLAASQWQQFAPTGQYAILWTYTLVFWGAAVWTARQPNLRSTAWMLHLVTLLLVAINTWAMDALRLWASLSGWLLGAIASGSLAAIVLSRLPHAPRLAADGSPRSRLQAFNYLGLSCLHWGWALAGWPLLAVYSGVIATILITGVDQRRSGFTQPTSAHPPDDPAELPLEPPPEPPLLTLGAALVAYGLVVLLVRAVFSQGVAIGQVGLAIGGCGWLLTELAQRWATEDAGASSVATAIAPQLTPAQCWERTGGALLILGWLAAIGTHPGQALVVSGLMLNLCHRRFRRSGEVGDGWVLFFIGLQGGWLLWRLAPDAFQQALITGLLQWTGAQAMPSVLLAIAGLPYLIGIGVYSHWLRRQGQLQGATVAARIAFLFGSLLTLISLANPVVRLLNLGTSTLILIGVWVRRPTPARALVYLTLTTGIATLCAAIDLWFPQMDAWQWAGVLLGQTLGLWGISLSRLGDRWRRSTWHLGLGLAGLSYVLLLGVRQAMGMGHAVMADRPGWPLIWLVVPLGLTVMTRRATPAPPAVTVPLTVVTLFLAQVLTLPDFRVRLLGLGAAAVLMVINAYDWPTRWTTAIALGFGLASGVTLLWEGWPGLPPLSSPQWLLAGALAIALLWGLYRSLNQMTAVSPTTEPPTTRPPLSRLYAHAADFWAIVLYGGQILALLLQVIARYSPLSLGSDFASPATGLVLGAALVTAAAVALRRWPIADDPSVYGIAVPLGLALAEAVWLAGGGGLALAVTYDLTGLLLMAWGRWRWRQPSPWVRWLPLVVALLGWALRLAVITAWTGGLTLVTAIVALGVGGQQPAWRPLQVMGLIGLSLGIYEGVGYQLAQTPGGNVADGLIVLAGTAAAMMLVCRSGQRFWVRLLNLPSTPFDLWANLHWGLGIFLMLLATLISLFALPTLKELGLAIAGYLCLYALLRGRHATLPEIAGMWVYAGLWQGLVLLGFARINWSQLSVIDQWLGFVACGLGGVGYSLPWQRWGWQPQPWRRSAIGLPLVTALMTTLDWLHPGNALIAAGYYGWLAYRSRNFRFTYVSVFLADWTIWRWLDWQAIDDRLLTTLPLALTLLYIAQFDPGLQQREQRDNRHWLRLVGLGLIQGVMLLSDRWTGLIVGIVSLLSILAGLGLKIRAPLYVGTVVFLADVFNQLVILNQIYPLTKWIVGLIAGSLLIWVAATFETRRLQWRSLVQSWFEILDLWE